MFCCPICRKKLIKNGNAMVCENSHSFDIARQGYVHLVPPNKINSKSPGDTKEMVDARRHFLNGNHYKPFKDKLSQLASSLCKNGQPILDSGCGEGYYTNGIKESCQGSMVYGFDISKSAIKAAAGMYKNISFAVASVFSIPFADSSVGLLTNVFAPAAEDELSRVLTPSSYMIMAVPGPRHLWGLKQVLYNEPYENPVENTAYKGFKLEDRISVRSSIHLEKDEPWQLFTMTPYYWKTDAQGSARLKNQSWLDTEIHFDFLLYRKT